MRPLEIFSGVILIVLSIASLCGPDWRGGVLFAAILAVTAMLGHLWFEGPRLQAAPFYLAILPAAILASTVGSRLFRWLASGGVSVGAIAGLVLCYAIPVFALPAPRGPFAIGSTVAAFTDSSREETNLPGRGQFRRFMAQIWYPASDCAGRRSWYRDLPTLNSWKSAHLRYIETHSCVDAPFLASKDKWPVVFFSPSSGGYRSQNTFLVEELASHGYVVVGMDHPYSCSRVAFPDGSVVYLREPQNSWLDLDSRASWAESIPRVEAMLDTNVRDIQFAYEQMEQGKLSGMVAEVSRGVDFGRTAAIGHSFGGGAAAELCRIDARFRAGVNFDGWMFHEFGKTGIDKPFLFVIADNPLWFANDGPYSDDLLGMARLGTKDYHDSIRASVRRWGGYILRPRGMSHGSFADMSLYLRWPLGGEKVNPETAMRLTRDFTLAFLNQHLKGKKSELLRTSAHAPTYDLQVFSGPAVYAGGSVEAPRNHTAGLRTTSSIEERTRTE